MLVRRAVDKFSAFVKSSLVNNSRGNLMRAEGGV
jgi:hypothetical protein